MSVSQQQNSQRSFREILNVGNEEGRASLKELDKRLTALSIEASGNAKDSSVDVEAEQHDYEEEEEEEVTFESLHTSPPTLDRHLRDRICILVAGKAHPVVTPSGSKSNGSDATQTTVSSVVASVTPEKVKDSNNNRSAAPMRPNVLPSDIYW